MDLFYHRYNYYQYSIINIKITNGFVLFYSQTKMSIFSNREIMTLEQKKGDSTEVIEYTDLLNL